MRLVGILMAAAAALTLSVAPALPASAITKSQLISKALSSLNMPSGWVVDSTSSGGISDLKGCLVELRQFKSPGRGFTRVTVNYTDGEFPSVAETLESGTGAASRYAAFVKDLNGCKKESVSTKEGPTLAVAVHAMPLPTLGDSSSAYAMTISTEGFNFGVDFVMFRAGSVVGDLAYEDSGAPDTGTFQAFALEAVNKIEGKPYQPPSATN